MRALYKGWKAFQLAGRKFLALEQKSGGNVHIYGDGFSNYRAWMSVESFRKKYKQHGEALVLD